ncbi:hypothetical protein MMC14_003397 [Varicellaria rhodocarpa]|nr:hypothetical protein [Varicellaria rhodocarpa]
MSFSDEAPGDITLPRILCLHGGGVTADIFHAQSRSIIYALRNKFRLIFVDAPWFCGPGPDIVPVYAQWGPFRRWLRWLPHQSQLDEDTAISELQYAIRRAMDIDPGTGPFVGVMGFSQGAKMAASLLYEQQLQEEQNVKKDYDFKFGILMAGRAPLVSLSSLSESMVKSSPPTMVSAAGISEGYNFDVGDQVKVPKIHIPTIHVHGLQDPGLHFHRRLYKENCELESTTLIEWEGAHRVPLKSKDVDPIVNAIMKYAKASGVV